MVPLILEHRLTVGAALLVTHWLKKMQVVGSVASFRPYIIFAI